MKAIVEEITRYLNLEKLLPSYRFHVTSACLAAIRRLQKFGHVPSASQLFKTYAEYGNFTGKLFCEYGIQYVVFTFNITGIADSR